MHTLWRNMIARCHTTSTTGYQNYGGRGIYVCKRWREDFEAFMEDMGERPTPKHEIDCINNNGPYSPSNCRWVTHSENHRNRRTNRLLTLNGETMTSIEWAERLHLNPYTLATRLHAGWTVRRALTTPPKVPWRG